MENEQEFNELDNLLIGVLNGSLPSGVSVDRLTTYDVDKSGAFAGLLIGSDRKGYAFEMSGETVRVGVAKGYQPPPIYPEG